MNMSWKGSLVERRQYNKTATDGVSIFLTCVRRTGYCPHSHERFQSTCENRAIVVRRNRATISAPPKTTRPADQFCSPFFPSNNHTTHRGPLAIFFQTVDASGRSGLADPFVRTSFALLTRWCLDYTTCGASSEADAGTTTTRLTSLLILQLWDLRTIRGFAELLWRWI